MAAPLDSSESAALRAFTQTGDYAPQAYAGKSESASREAVCEQAQKLLLLCAHLEDNILAARGLTHKISADEAVLQELLRGNDEREALEGMALQEVASTGWKDWQLSDWTPHAPRCSSWAARWAAARSTRR